MRHVVVSALILMLTLQSSCAGRSLFGDRYSSSNAVRHTVRAKGETLGSISRRYTGSSQNWRRIQSANPGIDAKQLQVGQSVWVPKQIIRRAATAKKRREVVSASAVALPHNAGEDSPDEELAIQNEILRERLIDAALAKECPTDAPRD